MATDGRGVVDKTNLQLRITAGIGHHFGSDAGGKGVAVIEQHAVRPGGRIVAVGLRSDITYKHIVKRLPLVTK